MANRFLPATRWRIVSPDPPAARRLAESLALTPITAQVLLNRGLDDVSNAARFLDASLADLSPPERLLDLGQAVDRLYAAVLAHERLIVYGDYDADGVTATAILVRGLRALGARAEFFVPRRQIEGYGLHLGAVEQLGGPGVLITVDCGIGSSVEIGAARSQGLDVLVLDHHEPGDALPPAAAVVDPKRADQPAVTPYAACGLAYQTVRALWRRAGREDPDELLDLVAVGTIADVVPLVDDNRILARGGLRRLSTAPSTGLAALLRQAEIAGAVSPRDVSFGLAPRLNAAGRLGDARVAVELLLTEDPQQAAEIASVLDQENRRRQEISARVMTEAALQVEEGRLDDAPAIVLSGQGWHPGVVGIVASHLKERYGRPVVMIAVEDGVGKGSARSIDPLPMVDALAACGDLLERFGGHAMAAGLTIDARRIDAFRERFLAEAAARLRPEDLIPAVEIDAVVSLGECTPALARELERLGPFGAGNPEPVLALRQVRPLATRVVGDGHLRLSLTDGHAFAEAIGFARGDLGEVLAFTGVPLDLACVLTVDRYAETDAVSLVVRDLVAPGLDLDSVLTDGRLLLDRLFERADEYLEGGWRGVEEAGAFYTRVVGVTFEGRQALLPGVRAGQALRLVREPTNPHDPHAVAVCLEDGRQLGYLGARLAARLAPSMDAGGRYSATASQLTGGGDLSYGLNIYIQRYYPSDRPSGADGWAEMPLEELIDHLRGHLQPGRALRQVQRDVVSAAAEGRPATTALGPGRRGAATVLMAAAAAVRRGPPVAVVLPLASQVDVWAERFAPLLRRLGLRVLRAHGALRLRAAQSLARALAGGQAGIMIASEEILRRKALSVAPGTEVIVHTADTAGFERAGPPRPDPVGLPESDPVGLPESDPVGLSEPDPVGRSQPDRVQPARVRFEWGTTVEPAEGEPAARLDDGYTRTNLRLLDRRDGGLDATLAGTGEREGKTLVFAPFPDDAVALARRLREGPDGATVAYVHGGLPERVRRVIEQLFQDGKIRTLVATAGYAETAAPGDIRRVVLARLPQNHLQFLEAAGLAGLDGRQATVVLAYARQDAARTETALEERYPSRARLAALYRVLREYAGRGPVLWPGEPLRRVLEAEAWSPRAVEAALETLVESGVIQAEVVEGRWRIELPSVPSRRELEASARYAEGERERRAHATLFAWAFGPASAILRALVGARPPLRSPDDASSVPPRVASGPGTPMIG